MRLVTITIKGGNNFTTAPENIKVYPSGDLDYRQAIHADFRQRVYGRNACGVIRASEVKNVQYY